MSPVAAGLCAVRTASGTSLLHGRSGTEQGCFSSAALTLPKTPKSHRFAWHGVRHRGVTAFERQVDGLDGREDSLPPRYPWPSHRQNRRHGPGSGLHGGPVLGKDHCPPTDSRSFGHSEDDVQRRDGVSSNWGRSSKALVNRHHPSLILCEARLPYWPAEANVLAFLLRPGPWQYSFQPHPERAKPMQPCIHQPCVDLREPGRSEGAGGCTKYTV